MNEITQFLIEVLFAIPIYMLLARILLQGFRAPFSDPIYQSLLRIFNPVLAPLQFIPRFRNWSLAAILLLYLICVLKAFALLGAVGIGPILLFGLVQLLESVLGLFTILIFIRIILSFVQANPNNAMVPLVYRLTEPLLAPLRRILPAMGPMDFSPILLFLIFLIFRVLVIQPLAQQAVQQVLLGSME